MNQPSSCFQCVHGYDHETVNGQRIELAQLRCGHPDSAEYATTACRASAEHCGPEGRWFERRKTQPNQWNPVKRRAA